MAELEFAPPQWVRCPKHRKCGPRAERLWDRSILVAQTSDREEPAIYDPRLTDGEIREMEISCVRGLGIELPIRRPHFRRFYRQFAREIGASGGRKTDYIMVQYNRDGAVHGYPVTVEYLRSKGASIP